MNLIDFLSSPWAIQPEKLLELQAIYATHFRGERIDVEAIEARLGRTLANEQKAYQLQDGTGVAVLEVSGVISPKANMFTRISGGATASILQQQVQSMLADSKVKAAVLNIDSPGGSVFGIPALGDAIRALAAAKPTVAVSTGMMASGGYWIGSAANAVYASGSTDMLGSIGVVATHSFDPKSADVQTTEITAGKYKRIVSDRQPLTTEGRAYMQAQVDHLYSVFVEAVASQRGVSVEDVLAHMADGRTFIGSQAVDAGLVDGIATVDQIVEQLATNPAAFANRRRAVFAAARHAGGQAQAQQPAPARAAVAALLTAPVPPHQPGVAMTPQEQAAAFAAEHAEAAALLRAEGSAAERTRITEVRAQALPGHEALVEQLAFDGKTTAAEAAMAINAAERTKLQAQGANRLADAPAPVPTAPVEGEDRPLASTASAPAGYGMRQERAQLHAEAQAYMKAHPGTDYVAAIKAVSANLQGA